MKTLYFDTSYLFRVFSNDQRFLAAAPLFGLRGINAIGDTAAGAVT